MEHSKGTHPTARAWHAACQGQATTQDKEFVLLAVLQRHKVMIQIGRAGSPLPETGVGAWERDPCKEWVEMEDPPFSFRELDLPKRVKPEWNNC